MTYLAHRPCGVAQGVLAGPVPTMCGYRIAKHEVTERNRVCLAATYRDPTEEALAARGSQATGYETRS